MNRTNRSVDAGGHNRWWNRFAIALLCFGLVLFIASLNFHQSEILSGQVAALVVVLISIISAVFSRQQLLAKIIIGIGITALVVGAAVAAYSHVMAAGWAGIK